MASGLFSSVPVLVRGGGDLGSGVIYRLHRAGFPVVVTERTLPSMVRRTVCFGAAVYGDSIMVEGITARLVPDADHCQRVIEQGAIPVLADETKNALRELQPVVVVDARMTKRQSDTTHNDAPFVVGLGPGFYAGDDCHAVIETNRGHSLGRVIYAGTAEPDTGVPGNIASRTHRRVLRAPKDGYVEPQAQIGDLISEGQLIAVVDDLPVVASFKGVLRGLIHPRCPATKGMKIGDLDPRANREHCFTISDKALAVGGGVLEAVLAAPQIRTRLWTAASHETPSGV
jgi:xanthine dehydrogenase accessory factor